MYSKSIDKLILELKKLPSVGQHTAERFVFYWLMSGKRGVADLMLALKDLIDNIKSCEICWDFSESSPCKICSDNKRDKTTICVVSNSQSIPIIEKTGSYNGTYHVLRGLIDSANIESIDKVKIPELKKRVSNDKNVSEIILALNPDLKGETTMMYLQKELKNINQGLKLTRLARGLPSGGDIQYADEITLGSALKHRY